jgi:hypothetical protein
MAALAYLEAASRVEPRNKPSNKRPHRISTTRRGLLGLAIGLQMSATPSIAASDHRVRTSRVTIVLPLRGGRNRRSQPLTAGPDGWPATAGVWPTRRERMA